MGQKISCDKCKKRDADWQVNFKNNDIDKYVSRATELNMLAWCFDALGYAKEKCKNLEYYVGHPRISCSLDKISIQSHLCENCYSPIEFNEIPEEWGFLSKFSEKGWYRK